MPLSAQGLRHVQTADSLTSTSTAMSCPSMGRTSSFYLPYSFGTFHIGHRYSDNITTRCR